MSTDIQQRVFQNNLWLKKSESFSHLFSSNLFALFFSFLRTHMATDRPLNRALPVATLDTTTVAWDGEAVET